MSNIRIEIAQPSHKQATVDFLLDSFLMEESLNRAVNLSKQDAESFFGELVDDGMKKPVSFVALNDQNQVIGCRLNEIADLHTKSQYESKKDSPHSEPVKKICGFLELLTKDVEKLLPPGTKRIMKFIIVCVHPNYQRRGIAKELIERTIKLAKENECEYVCTGATAFKSQQLFEKKLAFDTLRVIDHQDYRDPQTNERIFNCDDGTTCGKFMCKKL